MTIRDSIGRAATGKRAILAIALAIAVLVFGAWLFSLVAA